VLFKIAFGAGSGRFCGFSDKGLARLRFLTEIVQKLKPPNNPAKYFALF
jgi:hypothetical protein